MASSSDYGALEDQAGERDVRWNDGIIVDYGFLQPY